MFVLHVGPVMHLVDFNNILLWWHLGLLLLWDIPILRDWAIDLEIFLAGQFESLFIEIKSNASCTFNWGGIYRVPNTNEHDSIERYATILKQLVKYTNIILTN